MATATSSPPTPLHTTDRPGALTLRLYTPKGLKTKEVATFSWRAGATYEFIKNSIFRHCESLIISWIYTSPTDEEERDVKRNKERIRMYFTDNSNSSGSIPIEAILEGRFKTIDVRISIGDPNTNVPNTNVPNTNGPNAIESVGNNNVVHLSESRSSPAISIYPISTPPLNASSSPQVTPLDVPSYSSTYISYALPSCASSSSQSTDIYVSQPAVSVVDVPNVPNHPTDVPDIPNHPTDSPSTSTPPSFQTTTPPPKSTTSLPTASTTPSSSSSAGGLLMPPPRSLGPRTVQRRGRVLDDEDKMDADILTSEASSTGGEREGGGSSKFLNPQTFGAAGQNQLRFMELMSSNKSSKTGHQEGEGGKTSFGDKYPREKLTMEEVAKHKSATDCWVVLNGQVFDVTTYLDYHPGGKKILLAYSGKDVTDKFNKYHPWVNAGMILKDSYLGQLAPKRMTKTVEEL